jgi:hypothetical protein
MGQRLLGENQMTKPFAKAIAVVAFKLDPNVKASYRLAIASSAL